MAEINVVDHSTGFEDLAPSGGMSSSSTDPKSTDISSGTAPSNGSTSLGDTDNSLSSDISSETSTTAPQTSMPNDPMLSTPSPSTSDSAAYGSSTFSEDVPKIDDNMSKKPSDKPTSLDNKVKTFKPKTGVVSLLRFAVEILLLAIVIILFMQNKTLTTDKTNLSNRVTSLNQNAIRITDQQNATESAVAKLDTSLAGKTPVIIGLTTTNLAAQTSTLFTDAQTGDQLLIYVATEQAVVYRPSTDKIVAQGTLNYTVPTATSSASTTSTKS